MQRIIEIADAPHVVRGELLVLTYILASRRFGKPLLTSLLRSDIMLEEFPGYHWIIEEGEARGKEIGKATAMRRNVMQLVQNRLDDVPGDLAEGLEALGVQELEALFARVLEVQDSAEVKAALEPC